MVAGYSVFNMVNPGTILLLHACTDTVASSTPIVLGNEPQITDIEIDIPYISHEDRKSVV